MAQVTGRGASATAVAMFGNVSGALCPKPSTSIVAMARTSDSSRASTSMIRTFTMLNSDFRATIPQSAYISYQDIRPQYSCGQGA